MKTVITAIALSLVSAAAFAGGMSHHAATADQAAVRFVFQGDGLVPAYMNSASAESHVHAQGQGQLVARGIDTSPALLVFQGDGLVPSYSNRSTMTRAEVIAEMQASKERMDYVRVGDDLLPRDVVAAVKPGLAPNDAGSMS